MWQHLRHPNVVKLYGACDVGHFFFVSELASNGSVVEHLAAYRRKGIKCTPWKFLHEAALGLAYLHERKMVHGDLRGSNILIGSDGLAKLSELALSGSTRTSVLAGSTEGGVFGSTRWQSPERVEGGEATCASDVYSLGLCIVEAVSGKIPWKERGENDVMLWKKYCDPALEMRTFHPNGPLVDDVIALVVHMCDRDPVQRVSAAVAAQMLERLSAKEHQAASQQPESEPQTSIDEYRGGELRRLWDDMHTRMSTVGADTIQRHVREEVQAMFEHLGQTSHLWEVVEQFHRLLVDIDSMLRTDSYENQIQRLSSTRAAGFAMDAMRRRLDALWTSIDGSHFSSRESQKQLWREERAKQLDLFVSEVEQTLLVLNELETEEDRVALLALLESEKDNPMSKYTPGQLSVIKKAYDDLVQHQRQKQNVTKSDAVTTTPEWFLPWYELEIDNASCVGTGGFGGVYRARWLESEVVVKLLDQAGSGSMNDNSFASNVSSNWSSSRMTPSDPTTRKERAKVREMFAREVGVWFSLSHPHVIRLFGACHVGTLFFACEFASNGSLDSYLRNHPDELWRKLYEGALGVHYLHARGIVHGDLKCNNVLVGSDGKAKVTDFGLSSDSAVLDNAGTRVSDAWQWVAPECLEHGSSRLSSASDVYSLGMCIVEALRVAEESAASTSTKNDNECAIVPLPWGNLDNATVKYHVVRMRSLPLCPSVCSDVQWTLVTRMCAFDPSDRLNIGTVVDILGRLAEVDVSSDSKVEDVGTQPIAVGLDGISAAVAEMKSCIDAEHVAGSSSRKTLTRIFGLLWSRLDDLSRVLDDDSCGDVERLWKLVDQSRQSTKTMLEQGSYESLIAFTETAMRGYALHRGLDKLMEANCWRVDSEEGNGVHDWRRRCNEFMVLAADMSAVNVSVNEVVKTAEIKTEQTMQS
jgi:serine/threonine protein kinase